MANCAGSVNLSFWVGPLVSSGQQFIFLIVSKTMTKSIFLLGAGFSRAMKSEMPLLADLTEKIAKTEIGARYSHLGSIEEILSYLSQSLPWENQSTYLRKKADFIDITRLIGELIVSLQGPEKINFSKPALAFAEHIRKTEAHILTLNYDTVIEQIVQSIGDVHIDEMYPISLPPADTRDGAGLFAHYPTANVPTIYKLHGSINYFYSGAESYFGETIYYSHESKLTRNARKEKKDIDDKVPLIVPPTFDKTVYFNNETIRTIWRLASERLASATRLVVIGYSLPISDLMMRSFLKASAKSIKELVVVDPNFEVSNQFKKLLNIAEANLIDGAECFEHFVEKYCFSDLADDK